jgi:hypothetical protein
LASQVSLLTEAATLTTLAATEGSPTVFTPGPELPAEMNI